MNKKVWLGFIVSFIVLEILSFIVNGVLLMKDYDALKNVYRPEMKLYIIHLSNIFFSFFFAFIFSKGHEDKGPVEGLRYGLYIGLMVFLPAAYNQYAVFPLPYGLTVKWFVLSLISCMIAGLSLALVFKGHKGAARG